jgi:hypothetical protein
MSERSALLSKTADEQINTLIELFSTSDEASLSLPCREKLGDGSVAACASHTAENYLRIAAFLQGEDQPTGEHRRPRHRGLPFLRSRNHGKGHRPVMHGAVASAKDVRRSSLIAQLSAGREALNVLAAMSDAELDVVPPASAMRFCDGKRTLEQVLASLLNHQSHQVEALRTALDATS